MAHWLCGGREQAVGVADASCARRGSQEVRGVKTDVAVGEAGTNFPFGKIEGVAVGVVAVHLDATTRRWGKNGQKTEEELAVADRWVQYPKRLVAGRSRAVARPVAQSIGTRGRLDSPLGPWGRSLRGGNDLFCYEGRQALWCIGDSPKLGSARFRERTVGFLGSGHGRSSLRGTASLSSGGDGLACVTLAERQDSPHRGFRHFSPLGSP